jgi:hypothetical protein
LQTEFTILTVSTLSTAVLTAALSSHQVRSVHNPLLLATILAVLVLVLRGLPMGSCSDTTATGTAATAVPSPSSPFSTSTATLVVMADTVSIESVRTDSSSAMAIGLNYLYAKRHGYDFVYLFVNPKEVVSKVHEIYNVSYVPVSLSRSGTVCTRTIA